MSDERIIIERNVESPMRDGVVLRADVWRLEGDQPRPVILRRLPYNKAALAPNSDFFSTTDAVLAGYAVMSQDTRGRYASEGGWEAIMWEQEGRDTYDTVEWIAAQPWCDGNVGMAGGSYLGFVQWMGAAQQPPHLKAIAPAIAGNAQLQALAEGGAIPLNALVSWLAYMTLEWMSTQMAKGVAVDMAVFGTLMAVANDPREALKTLPLRDLPGLTFPGAPLDWEAFLAGKLDEAAQFDAADIKVPTLSMGGWFDVHGIGTVRGFQALAAIAEASGTGGPHHLLVGPWIHAGNLPSEQGDVNFGMMAEGAMARLGAKHLAFFDAHLRGGEDTLPPVEYFLMGADEWRTAEEWPPAGSAPQSWQLGADGSLGLDDPEAGHRAYDYDPADPVPTHGGRVLLGRELAGPRDVALIEQRPDVLTYESGVLDEPVDVVGPVRAVLHVTTSAADTDFVVRLTDVTPEGRSILVTDGILRCRYRDGLDREVPMVPGAPTEVVVDLGDTAWRFRPGHRIRVAITSSDFPRYDRNLNTGNAVGADAEGTVAHQAVLHGSDNPSRIELPILSA